MKTIFTFTFALLSFTFFAQTDTTKNDNETEIDLGDVSIIIKDKSKTTKVSDGTTNSDEDKPKEVNYPNVDFETSFGWGVAGYSIVPRSGLSTTVLDPKRQSSASYELDFSQSRNYVINGNLMIDLNKNFGLLTGIGFEFNRFVFRENLQLDPNEGTYLTDSVISFGSYKLRTNYVQIPLMLAFRSNNEKWKLALGGTFSYNIGNKVKQEYSIENVDYKSEIKGNYNMAPIKLSVGARLAYKGIGIYANYGLTPMNNLAMENIVGREDLMPFSVGITFGGL